MEALTVEVLEKLTRLTAELVPVVRTTAANRTHPVTLELLDSLGARWQECLYLAEHSAILTGGFGLGHVDLRDGKGWVSAAADWEKINWLNR